jgi:leader peptidase (prepilin peptidase) / N-methyltransferase
MDSITDWTLRLGWILPAWLFALGATIGSFLNVVVYRLPAGKSIVHPGSHCPACGHPIRWYHNLPIASWFVLGGRCSDCRAKISPRYPLVEMVTALLFLGLFLTGARPRLMALADPTAAAPVYSGWEVLVRYAVDLWLICTLLAAALIEYDGARAPRRIFGIAILVGLSAAATFPSSRLVAAAANAASLHLSPREQAFAVAAAGMLVGWAIGMVLEITVLNRLNRVEHGGGSNNVSALPSACVGTLLGWAAAIVVGLAAAVALIAMTKVARPQKFGTARWGFSAFAFLGALAWIFAARWLRLPVPLTPDP